LKKIKTGIEEGLQDQVAKAYKVLLDSRKPNAVDQNTIDASKKDLQLAIDKFKKDAKKAGANQTNRPQLDAQAIMNKLNELDGKYKETEGKLKNIPTLVVPTYKSGKKQYVAVSTESVSTSLQYAKIHNPPGGGLAPFAIFRYLSEEDEDSRDCCHAPQCNCWSTWLIWTSLVSWWIISCIWKCATDHATKDSSPGGPDECCGQNCDSTECGVFGFFSLALILMLLIMTIGACAKMSKDDPKAWYACTFCVSNQAITSKKWVEHQVGGLGKKNGTFREDNENADYIAKIWNNKHGESKDFVDTHVWHGPRLEQNIAQAGGKKRDGLRAKFGNATQEYRDLYEAKQEREKTRGERAFGTAWVEKAKAGATKERAGARGTSHLEFSYTSILEACSAVWKCRFAAWNFAFCRWLLLPSFSTPVGVLEIEIRGCWNVHLD